MSCPTPDKARYQTAREAWAVLELVRRTDTWRNPDSEGRIYHCPCDGWHLTSDAHGAPCGTLANDPRLRTLLSQMEERNTP